MNRKQKIIVSVTGIFLVLLLLVGLTYAYFLTRINGNTNTKSISVSTANLALVYGDGNNVITGDKIQPGTTLDTKTFTVTNEGNATADYVVVIEDVRVTYAETIEVDGVTQTAGASTTFASNDFIYTLTCESDGTACDGINYETQFPINGNKTVLVGNSIEVGKTHTYSLTVIYKETGVDQSADMNKALQAKVNIADPNGFNPYAGDKTTLAYNIINNAVTATTAEKEAGYAELRTTPLTTPAVEDTMLYTDNGAGTESTKNYAFTKTFTTTDAAKYYITYGDTYSYTTDYTITNKDGSSLQSVLLSTGYETLKGKYIVSLRGSTSTSPVSGSGKSSIYYVTNTKSDDSGVTIEYLLLREGLASNEIYITYGDSYKFNASTGKYTLNNVKVVKYSEGYNSVLPGKYVVNTSGTNLSTAEKSTNLSSIYLITGNSTETAIAYKTVTTADSYVSAESTLSMTPDEYGTSYYYRGGVKNNYLSFNNMCWRIVRIEGDGAIKIVLADATASCSTATLAKTDSAYIGTGGYGNTGYFADYETGSMKDEFNEWFTGTLDDGITLRFSEEAKSKLKSTTACIGDTTNAYSGGGLMTETEKQNAITNNSSFSYNSSVRLIINKYATLMCEGEKTSETQIFPLTADEVVFAGGEVNNSNYTYYLRENATSGWWWTLSPSEFLYISDLAFYVRYDGMVDDSPDSGLASDCLGAGYMGGRDFISLRPAVSLVSGTKIASGDGSIENPYIVN